MSSITVQDMIRCAAQGVSFIDPLPNSVQSYRQIHEDELLCDERLDEPLDLLPPPMILPTAMNHGTRLLAFEGRDATPLCLRAPTSACRKRVREQTEEESVNGIDEEIPRVSPKVPRKNEEWLSWINWNHFAQ